MESVRVKSAKASFPHTQSQRDGYCPYDPYSQAMKIANCEGQIIRQHVSRQDTHVLVCSCSIYIYISTYIGIIHTIQWRMECFWKWCPRTKNGMVRMFCWKCCVHILSSCLANFWPTLSTRPRSTPRGLQNQMQDCSQYFLNSIKESNAYMSFYLSLKCFVSLVRRTWST